MKALKDHEIIEIRKNDPFFDNRGFRYGDGLFETIAVIRGTPRLLDRHLERLQKGANILGMNVNKLIDLVKINKSIKRLQEENKLFGDATIRLMIWRQTGGLYMPLSKEAEILMTIEEAIFKKVNSVSSADFSKKTINFPSPTSPFKTMSALKYVMAGIEKRERKLDEIIILDYQGYVSEALSSNIFWKKDNTYFTPPLTTGCIDGIMRNWLISAFKMEGYTIEEKLAVPSEIVNAEHIFTSNANGVGHIRNIGGVTFEIDAAVRQIMEKISK